MSCWGQIVMQYRIAKQKTNSICLLMKFDIIKVYRFSFSCSALLTHQEEYIIQAVYMSFCFLRALTTTGINENSKRSFIQEVKIQTQYIMSFAYHSPSNILGRKSAGWTQHLGKYANDANGWHMTLLHLFDYKPCTWYWYYRELEYRTICSKD